MTPNEIKLLSSSPSITNWPKSLALGAFVILTGAISMALLITTVPAGLVMVCAGISLTVWPALQAANTEYFVSNMRVLICQGFFHKKERFVSLSDIREIHIRRTPLQEKLGTGDVELVCLAGRLVLEGMEDPEKVREKILTLR